MVGRGSRWKTKKPGPGGPGFFAQSLLGVLTVVHVVGIGAVVIVVGGFVLGFVVGIIGVVVGIATRVVGLLVLIILIHVEVLQTMIYAFPLSISFPFFSAFILGFK